MAAATSTTSQPPYSVSGPLRRWRQASPPVWISTPASLPGLLVKCALSWRTSRHIGALLPGWVCCRSACCCAGGVSAARSDRLQASIRQAAISQRPSSEAKFEVVIVNSSVSLLVLVLVLVAAGQRRL